MKNSENLDDFYKKFKKLHKEKVANWRFGQLISYLFEYISFRGQDPFFLEEDQMLKALDGFLNTDD